MCQGLTNQITHSTPGMRVAAMSLISNLACGMSLAPITHAEVIEAGQAASARFESIVTQFVKRV